MGRLTFNPLAHLDFMGVLAMVVTQFRFGWAKPVPVNPYNLRNPRKANLWISAAGPLSNFGLAIIFGFLFRIFYGGIINVPPVVLDFLMVCVQINVTLALFNLIPLFPLDGSHILESLLPQEYGPRLAQIQRFGPFILIFLLVVGGFWIIIGPFVIFFVKLFTGLF
jgi:Zn-dependent protease